MSRSVKKNALTLLELVIVVTLLALGVGVSTLAVPGVSDQARLQTAAAQIGAVVRLASCAATRSNRPNLLQFDDRGCCVKRPVRQEGEWVWSSPTRIDLIKKVHIVDVYTLGEGPGSRRSGPPWPVMVQPGTLNSTHGFRLALANGKCAFATVDALTGIADVRFVDDDWD